MIILQLIRPSNKKSTSAHAVGGSMSECGSFLGDGFAAVAQRVEFIKNLRKKNVI